MRFKVLIDGEKLNPEYTTGWGVSVYFPDLMLLFDTGENPLSLEENLNIAGIENRDIKHIFIPKEGWEHTGGIEAVIGVDKIVYVPSGVSNDLTEMIHSVGSECRIIEKTEEILPSVSALRTKDSKIKEMALLIKMGFEASIFGGSEGGILPILEDQGIIDKPINLLFGRLNPLSYSEKELLNLAGKLDLSNPKKVAPANCSGDLALEVFKRYFKDRFITVGIGLEGEV